MNWRKLFFVLLLFGMFAASPMVATAEACPMCKAANESDSSRARAYMYSILFMLSMPAMLLTGYGVGFYRLSKMNVEPTDADLPDDDEPASDSEAQWQ